MFPEPAKADGVAETPAVAVVLFAFEPVELLGVLPEEPELLEDPELPEEPELPDELEPSLELMPPRAPTEGEMLSGASFARAANVVIVREAFLAGLRKELVIILSMLYCRVDIRVNNPNHAILTMISLGAVVPNGLRIIDHDGIRWHVWSACLDRHEARKQTWLFRLDIIDGHAGFIERRLNDGMILFGVRINVYAGKIEGIPLGRSGTAPMIQPQLSDY